MPGVSVQLGSVTLTLDSLPYPRPRHNLYKPKTDTLHDYPWFISNKLYPKSGPTLASYSSTLSHTELHENPVHIHQNHVRLHSLLTK